MATPARVNLLGPTSNRPARFRVCASVTTGGARGQSTAAALAEPTCSSAGKDKSTSSVPRRQAGLVALVTATYALHGSWLTPPAGAADPDITDRDSEAFEKLVKAPVIEYCEEGSIVRGKNLPFFCNFVEGDLRKKIKDNCKEYGAIELCCDGQTLVAKNVTREVWGKIKGKITEHLKDAVIKETPKDKPCGLSGNCTATAVCK